MFQYNTERISCCKKLNQIGSKKTLRLIQEALHYLEFCLKVDYI